MATENAEWFRKRMLDALERRAKSLEASAFIPSKPMPDQQSVSPEDPTDDVFSRLEDREKTASSVFIKAAKAITPQLVGLDESQVSGELRRIWWKFEDRIFVINRIESAKKAKSDLLKLAENSYELASTMLNLGEGALEILARNRVRISEVSHDTPLRKSVILFSEWQASWRRGEPLPENRSEKVEDELANIVTPGLIENAEPFNLPGSIPYEPNEFEDDEGLYDYEWGQGGPWVIRLRALAELAEKNADYLGGVTGKGGRKSFGSRLHGSPDHWLARACKEFAEAHGCKSQAVATKMVQAVMEAEYGKEAMKNMDGKPSKHKGRKAVRKLAQTKPKTGTV